MNERIRELKIQATLWCDDNIADQYSEETNGYGAAWEDKFAELIVRECALIAFHNVVNLSCIADAEDVETNIKDHFGVEE